jgi:hypothetical protein
MSGEFRCGATIELCVDANAIPAGRYMYLGEESGFLLFSIGRDVLFGLAEAHWKPFLRTVPGLKPRRTSKGDFVNRYYELLAVLKPASIDPRKFTFCALNPNLLPLRSNSERLAGSAAMKMVA